MKLRIGSNDSRKQFAGIGREHLYNIQNDVQYLFLHPVRIGQDVGTISIKDIYNQSAYSTLSLRLTPFSSGANVATAWT